MIMAAVIPLMMVATIERNDIWRSERTLWADAVAKSPQSPMSRSNLALDYHRAGNFQRAFTEYQETMRLASARHDFRSLDILVTTQNNLGNLLINTGHTEDGESALQASLTLSPYNGATVIALAHLWNVQGKYGDGLSLIEQSLQHGLKAYGQHGGGFGGAFTGVGRLYFERGVAFCGLGIQKQSDLNFEYASRLDADIGLRHCKEI